MRPPSTTEPIVKIDSYEIFYAAPEGKPLGLYIRWQDDEFPGGYEWDHIPLSYEDKAERDRLRGLRLEAVKRSSDPKRAREIYAFLRDDRA